MDNDVPPSGDGEGGRETARSFRGVGGDAGRSLHKWDFRDSEPELVVSPSGTQNPYVR
jgi:hypothetical protein